MLQIQIENGWRRRRRRERKTKLSLLEKGIGCKALTFVIIGNERNAKRCPAACKERKKRTKPIYCRGK